MWGTDHEDQVGSNRRPHPIFAPSSVVLMRVENSVENIGADLRLGEGKQYSGQFSLVPLKKIPVVSSERFLCSLVLMVNNGEVCVRPSGHKAGFFSFCFSSITPVDGMLVPHSTLA